MLVALLAARLYLAGAGPDWGWDPGLGRGKAPAAAPSTVAIAYAAGGDLWRLSGADGRYALIRTEGAQADPVLLPPPPAQAWLLAGADVATYNPGQREVTVRTVTGQARWALRLPARPTVLAASGDGSLAFAYRVGESSPYREEVNWRDPAGRPKAPLPSVAGVCTALALSPAGDRLAVASVGAGHPPTARVAVYEGGGAARWEAVVEARGPIQRILVSPSGQVTVAAGEGLTRFNADGSIQWRWRAPGAVADLVELDGGRLAVLAAESITLLDRDGRARQRRRVAGAVRQATLSPDAQRLAVLAGEDQIEFFTLR